MIKDLIISWYRRLFAHPSWYGFNLHLYKLSLRGLGILNAEGPEITGEDWLLDRLSRNKNIKAIFDVGANLDVFGVSQFPKAKIYAFEPHPESVKKLRKQRLRKSVTIFPNAVGDANKNIRLWDFAADAELKDTQPTSTLASLNKDVIESLHGQKAMSYPVKMVMLDAIAKKNNIERIDILKIDVEGYELKVLEGAKKLLAAGAVGLIQFEFNEMHPYQRVFFKDIVDALADYQIYRLLPTGLLPLGEYRPLTHEIFGFQNIVAIRKAELDNWKEYLPLNSLN